MTRLLLILAALLLSVATVQAQVGQCAVPIGPLLPDFVPSKQVLNEDISTSLETFAADDCNISEGSLPGAGTYPLLRFASGMTNDGQADLTIGRPDLCPQLFEFSACHNHYHVKGYTNYRLWTMDGWKQWVAARDLTQPITGTNNEALLTQFKNSGALVTGQKQGFCMIDSVCGNSRFDNHCFNKGLQQHFLSCTTNQGLSVGWTDVYGSFLDGQFINLTGVPSGKYMLELHVNPDHVLPESDKTNNSVATPLTIK